MNEARLVYVVGATLLWTPLTAVWWLFGFVTPVGAVLAVLAMASCHWIGFATGAKWAGWRP